MINLNISRWWNAQPKKFSDAYNPRSNAFGFLRLCLASLVIVSHAYPLGGKYGTEILSKLSHGQENLGSVAVIGFFILSGFLIAGSYDHLKSMPRFLWHRFLRIMPGFWVSLAVVAVGFGSIFYYHYHHSLSGFLNLAADGPISFIINNFFLVIRQFEISNLSAQLIYPGAFNGSLWTLAYEFFCYLIIGTLGTVGILKKKRYLTLVLFISVYALYSFNIAAPDAAAGLIRPLKSLEFLKLITAFLAGAAVYVFQDRLKLSSRIFLLSILTLLVAIYFGGLLILEVPLLTYILMYLAAYLPIRSFDRKIDLSYGVYIYAFPVQQTFSLFGLNNLNIAVYCVLALAATLPLAFLSYVAIERPAMKLKNLQVKSNILSIFNPRLLRKRKAIAARS